MRKFERIRELRELAGLTTEEMGSALNLSERAYVLYENGERTIPARVLCDLVEFHGVSADYLLGLADEKKPYPRSI